MKTVVEFPDQRAVIQEAAEWLIRLDGDTPPSAEELQSLGEWLQRSPVHREQLERLAALWNRLNVLTELAVPLGHRTRPAAPSRVARVAFGRTWWRPAGLVAAALALLTLGIVLFRADGVDSLRATNGLYATVVGQQKITTLADGSQIALNTDSQVQVDYDGKYRNVRLLRGEALFTVAKNAERPFRVYAGDGRVEALGTAFSVHLNGKHISVAVTEGRVSLASAARPLSSRGGQGPAIQRELDMGDGARDDTPMEALATLEAGHVATLRSSVDAAEGDGSTLEAVKVVGPEELAQRLAWRDGILMFSGETLEEVVREFSRYTTTSIEVPDATVRSMRIGGRFAVGETEAMLSALQTNFKLRVTRVAENHVIISAAEE